MWASFKASFGKSRLKTSKAGGGLLQPEIRVLYSGACAKTAVPVARATFSYFSRFLPDSPAYFTPTTLPMKILVIEDEPEMLQNLVQFLEKEKYLVETATTFDEAWDKIGVYEYDCILLDINLPGGSGLELLEELKSQQKSDGVIIISARNSVDDRIAGLDLGADDYLPKPFHLAELHARVKSVLRRRKFEGNQLLQLNNLWVDFENRSVQVNGQELPLNRKELDILLYLISNKNRLVTKTSLAEHVWGDHIDEADSFEFIYSQIKNLRKKLKDQHAEVEVQAVYGIGYKLVLA